MMATPKSPRPNDTQVSETGNTAASVSYVPVPGYYDWRYYIDNDAETFTLQSLKGELWSHVADIPLPCIAFHRGDGLLYGFNKTKVGPFRIAAESLEQGRGWGKFTYLPRHAHNVGYAAISHIQDTRLPVVNLSPLIVEDYPPLAPTFTTTQDDEDRARKGWAWLGHRLAPAGRLTVGLTLGSPWLEPMGATSIVWSLWGQAGAGKSLLGRVCAATYGSSKPNVGVFHSFNSTPQGIPSLAQELSYLPLVLDETTSQSSLGDTLKALMTGANRKRVSRLGERIESGGRWSGAVVVTGNEPLAPKLTDEQFSRRLVELEARSLWDVAQIPEDAQDRANWWREIANSVAVLEGWPWQALTRTYGPGVNAIDYLTRLERLSLPGDAAQGGMANQLAYRTCEWLAEWTGDDVWLEGVWDAALTVCRSVTEQAHDVAQLAATALVEHRIMRPLDWTTDARERAGWPAYGVLASCGLSHEGVCDWWDITKSAHDQIVNIAAARLGRSNYASAIYSPELDRLTRKVQQNGVKFRAYTVCFGALGELAVEYIAPEAPVIAPPQTASLPFPDPEPVVETVETVTPGEGVLSVMDSLPIYGFTLDDDPELALPAALADGYTDLVATDRLDSGWNTKRLEELGWDVGGWTGTGRSAIITKDDAAIRMILHLDPEQHAAALRSWATITGQPVGASVPSLGVRVLREIAKGDKPRWLLPDNVADTWTHGEVAHPARWGEVGESDAQFDRVRSHLPAITQARLAPLFFGENYERFDGEDVPDPTERGRVGMYRITVPEFDPRLPAPVGNYEPGRVLWTTSEVVRLYIERGVTPHILEAWLAPARRVRALHDWSEQVKTWLDECEGTDALPIAKGLYQSLAGRLMSPHGRKQRWGVYRPDWGWAIRDNSWCSVLRKVYAAADNENRYPTAVRTDAVFYADPTPPASFVMGDGLGQFKAKGV